MRIGYKVFGQNSLCYGLSYCLYKNGIAAVPVTEKTASVFDVVLFSVFWWQHVYDFVAFCNKAGIGKHAKAKTRVIVGGFNSFNPLIFQKYAHAVCVGDGEDVIPFAVRGQAHPSIYTGTEARIQYATADISQNGFVYSNEANIARIEVARGCKYRCKFCQLAHMKKYREVSFEQIESSLSKVKSKRVALFAPNKTSHSRFEDIKTALQRSKKIDVVPDVRFNEIEKFYSNTGMQIGIEGISQKLRFSVGKALTDDRFREIVKFIIEKSVIQGNSPHLFTGFILDLPGESDEDWKAFGDFLDGLQDIKNVNLFCLFFVFNLFMPSPFTPLEDAEIHPDRDYQSKIKSVLGADRKFRVCVRGRLFSNYARVLSMIATRGGADTIDIINTITADKSLRCLPDRSKLGGIKYLLKRWGGIERFIGMPQSKPWSIVDL